jgi:hypothetical protein
MRRKTDTSEPSSHIRVLIAEKNMPRTAKTPSIADYYKLADDLDAMSVRILTEPDPDYEFANRLALHATEMREDCFNVHFAANDQAVS